MAVSPAPPATACWPSSPASSTRSTARWRSSKRSADGKRGLPDRAPPAVPHRHQCRRRHGQGRRHLWRWRQHRRAAGSAGRTGRHLRLARRARPCAQVGPFAFEDLGEQSVKNIDQPIRAFRLRGVIHGVPPAARRPRRCRPAARRRPRPEPSSDDPRTSSWRSGTRSRTVWIRRNSRHILNSIPTDRSPRSPRRGGMRFGRGRRRRTLGNTSGARRRGAGVLGECQGER